MKVPPAPLGAALFASSLLTALGALTLGFSSGATRGRERGVVLALGPVALLLALGACRATWRGGTMRALGWHGLVTVALGAALFWGTLHALDRVIAPLDPSDRAAGALLVLVGVAGCVTLVRLARS